MIILYNSIILHRYEYAERGSDAARAGQTWTRSYLREYLEPYSLPDLTDIYRHFDWPDELVGVVSAKPAAAAALAGSRSSARGSSGEDESASGGGGGGAGDDGDDGEAKKPSGKGDQASV